MDPTSIFIRQNHVVSISPPAAYSGQGNLPRLNSPTAASTTDITINDTSSRRESTSSSSSTSSDSTTPSSSVVITPSISTLTFSHALTTPSTTPASSCTLVAPSTTDNSKSASSPRSISPIIADISGVKIVDTDTRTDPVGVSSSPASLKSVSLSSIIPTTADADNTNINLATIITNTAMASSAMAVKGNNNNNIEKVTIGTMEAIGSNDEKTGKKSSGLAPAAELRPPFIKTSYTNDFIYGGNNESLLSSSSATATISNGENGLLAADNSPISPSVRHRDSLHLDATNGGGIAHNILPGAAPGLTSKFIPKFPSTSVITTTSNGFPSSVHNSPSAFPVNSINNSSFLYPRHLRSKSFSETVSETSQVAIRQLAAPISLPLIITCLGWYATSAMSNTLNKSILTAFPYPVSLSMVQFFLAVCFGVLTLNLARMSPIVAHYLPRGVITHNGIGLRKPTRQILMATAPMGLFQLSGHILSHMSTSLIPVSLVHTTKALSPLFTVAAYRLLFGVRYQQATYLSLVPLTSGVIMTCSVEFSSHFMGIIYALLAALIFVSQNMFSKKLLTASSNIGSNNTSGNSDLSDIPKLDKLNVLCYCSSLAFIFTFPLWFFSEGIGLIGDYVSSSGEFFGATSESSNLLLAFLADGIVHFLQNILAFQVLGMVSPVTYSVASLIKRIVVITVAIFWFGQDVSATQGWGILLTFLGLYLYDRVGGDKSKHYETKEAGVLPK